jgi:hypothetical protein
MFPDEVIVPNSALQPASSEGESRRGFGTPRAASTRSSSLIILGASLCSSKLTVYRLC